MDFALSEEQEMFRGYVYKYLDGAGQTKIARDFANGHTDGFQAIWSGLAELGCMGITIPEEYGGLELGALDLVPVLEEMGRVLLPGAYLETVAFAVPLLEKYGTEEQKEKYLTEIAAGSRSMTLAWLEPQKGYNPEEISCTARVEGDSLVIDGVKVLVPGGGQVDSYLVLVRTNDGLSLVIVDRTDAIEVNAQKSIDETLGLSELTFQQVRISQGQILGPIDQGWSVLQEGLLSLNAALTSVIVGGMEKVVDMSVEYVKIREQFGQPIGRFQALKHRIADMKMELETARSLSHYANWAFESGEADCEAAIYSARTFATEAYINVASHNIQNHGGIGFTEEIDCHLFLKRARFYESYLGSSQHYKEQAALALAW